MQYRFAVNLGVLSSILLFCLESFSQVGKLILTFFFTILTLEKPVDKCIYKMQEANVGTENLYQVKKVLFNPGCLGCCWLTKTFAFK